MNPPERPQIDLHALFTDAFRRAGAAKQIVALLAGFTLSLRFALFYPFQEFSNRLLNTPLGEWSPIIDAESGTVQLLIFASFAFLAVYSIALVMLARAATLGPRATLAGGTPALLRRMGSVYWRVICAYGWFILLFFPAVLLSAMAFGEGISPPLGLYLMLITVPIIAVAIITFLAAARDRTLNMRQAYNRFEGFRLQFTLTALIILLASLLVTAILGGLLSLIGLNDSAPGFSLALLNAVDLVMTYFAFFLLFRIGEGIISVVAPDILDGIDAR